MAKPTDQELEDRFTGTPASAVVNLLCENFAKEIRDLTPTGRTLDAIINQIDGIRREVNRSIIEDQLPPPDTSPALPDTSPAR